MAPLFALLGDEAGFFVARGSRPVDLLILAVAYGLLPPVAAGTLAWGADRARPGLGRGVLVGLVGLLTAALVLPLLGGLLGGSAVSLPLAVIAGGAAGAAYVRAPAAGTLLTALSPAPLVLVGFFLVVSPASELLRSGDASGSVAGPATSTTPIVQVVFDELPITTLTDAHGHLDAARFPQLARLARTATWYRHATTVTDSTLEAVPVQVTGERARFGSLPTTKDHPHSLFTLFSRSHDLLVVEPITDVCPARLCVEARERTPARLRALGRDLSVVVAHLLLPADLRGGLAPIDRTWEGFGSPGADEGGRTLTGRAAEVERSKLGKAVGQHLHASDASADFARLAGQLRRRRTRPPLVFLHSTLPHAPWRLLPDGRRYPLPDDDPQGLEGKRWTRRQWAVDQSFQRHVLQTQYADALLGGLLDALRASGRFDDAVVVVTADHGASFHAGHSRRTVTLGNRSEIAGVPFIVKWPGQRTGRIDDGAVRTVDVLPTIAKAAGVRVPWKTDGVPADERRTDGAARIAVARAGASWGSVPLAAVLARQRARNAAEARVLRHGTYAIGPRPDLIGRRVAPRMSGARRATVDAARAYARVDAGASVLPALVSGSLRGVDADAVIAVAVNGRVAATTRAYPVGDRVQYRALLPPAALPGGPAIVTVLAVMPGDRLHAIGGTAPAAR